MSPRQRRGLVMMTMSVIGAVAVFLSVFSYVADVESRVGPAADVLRLRRGVAAHDAVTADDVETVELPQRWLPGSAISDPAAVIGRVAELDQPAGALVQAGMFGDPPRLAPGEVEHPVLVGAETGLAVGMAPGDLVNIWVAYTDAGSIPRSRQVVSGARVLSAGETSGDRGNGGGRPMILAVHASDAGCLTWAETFAESVRVARAAVEPPSGSAVAPSGCPVEWTSGLPVSTAPGSRVDDGIAR